MGNNNFRCNLYCYSPTLILQIEDILVLLTSQVELKVIIIKVHTISLQNSNIQSHRNL